MQQCSQCRRFISDEVSTCTFCSSPGIFGISINPGHEQEFSNYRISADEIIADGKSYRVIGAVGQGGHGIVLKVESLQGKCWAIKVPLEFNESFSNSQGNKKSLLDISYKYISHEVEMLGKISSKALLDTIYAGDVICRGRGVEREFPAILMELAFGTLKDVIDSEMANILAVPYEEKIKMIRQLTENLEQLHQKIVVHRDISPHNVFIVDREKKIKYVLGDFGTSKPANIYDVDNSTTRMAFHDRYLDPALFMVDRFRYDPRIDIYQLGVMITEILLGEYWRAEDEETAANGIQGVNFEKDFLMIFAVNDIHPYIVEKIRKATTLKINYRYHSAAEFKNEIHKALLRVEKKGKQFKPKKLIKKNISISYRRILQSPPPGDELEENANENRNVSFRTIDYKGQKKIDMGSADQIRLCFTGVNLKKAKIIGASFLACQQFNNSIQLQVDREDIKKKVKPIMKTGIITRLSRFLGFTTRDSRLMSAGKISKKSQSQSRSSLRIEFDCQAILYLEFGPAGAQPVEMNERPIPGGGQPESILGGSFI